MFTIVRIKLDFKNFKRNLNYNYFNNYNTFLGKNVKKKFVANLFCYHNS